MSAEPADIILRHMADLAEAAARRPAEQRGAVVASAAKRLRRALGGRYISADDGAYEVFVAEWREHLATGEPFQTGRVAKRCNRSRRTIARWLKLVRRPEKVVAAAGID